MCEKTTLKKANPPDTMDNTTDERKETSSDDTPVRSKKVSPRKRDRIRNTLRITKKVKPSDDTFDKRFLGESQAEQTKFWKSPLLILQYVIVAVAILSRRLWVLQGILFVLLACMAHVIYNWICHIISDPELHRAIASMRWYFGFAVQQAEATIYDAGKGRRFVEAGFLAGTHLTATSLWSWFYRQRLHNVNQTMIKQHQANMERWRR